MAINKYQPHVLILPEDDANRQMAANIARKVTERMRRTGVIQVLQT